MRSREDKCKTCGGPLHSTGGPGESFICYPCEYKPATLKVSKKAEISSVEEFDSRIKNEYKTSTKSIAEILFNDFKENYERLKHERNNLCP